MLIVGHDVRERRRLDGAAAQIARGHGALQAELGVGELGFGARARLLLERADVGHVRQRAARLLAKVRRLVELERGAIEVARIGAGLRQILLGAGVGVVRAVVALDGVAAARPASSRRTACVCAVASSPASSSSPPPKNR